MQSKKMMFDKKKSYLKIQRIKINEQNDFNERQRICRIIADSRFFGRKINDPVNLDNHVMAFEVYDLISKIPNRIGVIN